MATRVAPLVGAWIEIPVDIVSIPVLPVAPLVGAWIEIRFHHILSFQDRVAPLVGAWIEIACALFFAPNI